MQGGEGRCGQRSFKAGILGCLQGKRWCADRSALGWGVGLLVCRATGVRGRPRSIKAGVPGCLQGG